MECNRDEAKRAKEIAESKFTSKDIAGAKKFALKAQSLYPELDGISQFLATLDVYTAAENKIKGEPDFYGVLGVNPSADGDTVRKHYRKLALSLHPDKNKSLGAEGAFKYVSEAWSLLSDKVKRSAYDQKRNVKVFKQKGQTQNGGAPAAPPPSVAGQNGFYNFAQDTATQTKGTTSTPKANTNLSTSSKQASQRTFWTVCHGCKMQYEYLRIYLYQNLLCPNCHEPFLAMETPPPNTTVFGKTSKSSKGATKNTANPGRHKTSQGCFGDSTNHSSFQWGPFSKTSGPASATQAATMVQRAYDRVKREREESQAAIKREEALRRKKSRKTANFSASAHLNSMKRKQGMDGFGANKQTWPVNSITSTLLKQGNTRPDSVKNLDIQSQLVEKARNEIRKKLREWRSKPVEDRVNEKVDSREEERGKVNAFDLKKIPTEPLVIIVPDPDFHDFDRDRTERCFGEGQVWAAYDENNGMPRYYAMIRRVDSMDPFKIKVTWLDSRTRSQLGPFSFVSKGFGEFKTGKNDTLFALDFFSHKVNFTKLANGIIEIYPRKGDVWALYRHWSPKWDEETPNEVKHKYELVEVDEYDEETGFTVIQLVKVAGFKAVFHRNLNPKEARVIPENEMSRFSHRIPSYLLTGQESKNAPKGCREVDPAATPSELLQVITVVEETAEDQDCVLISDDSEEVLADVKGAADMDMDMDSEVCPKI